MLILNMLFQAVGGLAIFLLGMKFMSEGMQAVAGQSLRRMIGAVTENRLLATTVGVAVTCLVQSSTVTTVLVVGLVNAGFMALKQAVGVILGANIGTTITGWILVLQVGKYGLPILGVAGLVYLFARKDRWRFISMAVMGFGLIFFGLELMKVGFAPMADDQRFIDAFAWFTADSYGGVLLAALVGCVLTLLVQSSSATLVITIGLTATGVIPFPTAAALVLGENLGTTITAWLASLNAGTNAKRAAYGHVLFNLIGVFWITAIFRWYLPLIDAVVGLLWGVSPVMAEFPAGGSDAEKKAFDAVVTSGIAAVHTGFNVVNTLLFLPFLPLFVRLLEWIVPDRGVKEVPHLRFLDSRLVHAPAMAIEQSRGEVLNMARGTSKMMSWIRETMLDGTHDEKLIQKTFHREEVLDQIEQEIVAFLTEVLDSNVPHSVAEEARQQLRAAHEYESVSDAIVSVLKGYLRLKEEGLELSEQQRAALAALHQSICDYLEMVNKGFEHNRPEVVIAAQEASARITAEVKRLRNEHVALVVDTRPDPRLSLIYTGLLTDYRRVKEHALNIAEVLEEVA